ncbi:phage head-tail adaptor, putative, SPP1 family [Phyllobacterium sp. OV277]|jgi:SPP1 family predicted phage head-tail adaptor|nr:phage head closure protein [Phyllobacterium sp. OV277]SDP03902.1 phage head-tail adaptor, putative, SPP1 family [Phyllobacterium sp. OV277]
MPTLFIDPGKLAHELQLERAVLVDDDVNGSVEEWREIATLWAHIEPAGAATVLFGEQSLTEVTHRITMRSRDDLQSGMRLRRGSRFFQLITIHDPDETGRYLICRAREEGL